MKLYFSRDSGLMFGVIVAVALILALNVPILNSIFKNAVFSVFAGAQKTLWAAGADARGFFAPLQNAGSLADENERLRATAAGFLVQKTQIEALKKENDFLRQGLNLEMGKDFDLKLANIAGKSAGRDVLIVDKGARDMVQVGMLVVDSQKALAGKVIKTYDNFSEVRLITDKDFSFDVAAGDNAIDGLFKGRGDYQADIDLVSKDKDLAVGQLVVTSGLGGIFPSGLLAGTIVEVRKNDVETFQSARVAPVFDAIAARQVFVAIDKQSPDASLMDEINQSADE